MSRTAFRWPQHITDCTAAVQALPRQLLSLSKSARFAIYDDTLSEAIVLLKYEEVTRLGQWFAERLTEIVLQAPDQWQADDVVPVPLHPERRRERGYNQAEGIARPLAKRLKLPFDSKLLLRTKPRPLQLALSRTEHWKSVGGAYATREGSKVDDLRVLLVDDVLTTGATLDCCVRALKKARARAILGLTVGRVCFKVNVPASPVPGTRADTRGKPAETPRIHSPEGRLYAEAKATKWIAAKRQVYVPGPTSGWG